ncbi:MAG: oligosaccharide flippase family protein, partial [ANME-2 cluster archaeon]|nr:oligosaccharide flippase family protein [ANME-2 cluster archaeon]
SLFLTLPAVLAIPLLPMISEIEGSNREKASSIVPRILRMVMLIMLPVIIGVGIVAKFLISLLYGQVYIDAYLIAYLLVLTSFPIALSSIISTTLMAVEKTWVILGLNIVWALFFIPSAYFLINIYGLTGLGVAYLVSGICFFIIELAYFSRGLNMDLTVLRMPIILGFIFGIIGFFVISLDNVEYILLYDFIIIIVLMILEYFILTLEEKEMVKTLLMICRKYIRPGI